MMDPALLGVQLDLLRASTDYFAVVDADTRVLDASATWTALLGHTPDSLSACRLSDLLASGDRERLAVAVERALSAGGIETVEVRVARGDTVPPGALELRLKARGDAGVIAVFARDLTALKDSQARLADAETRIHELRRLESIALLAGGIMHHVNNLFCVSMGYLKMLADEIGESAPARGYLQEVQGATDRAADLVRQLVGLSRDSDPGGSAEVVGAVQRLELLIRQLVTEQVDFRLELGPGQLPEVRAGRAQVEQLLVNLAFASREAMPDGGELHVSVTLASSLDALSLAFKHRARARRPGPRVQLVEPLPGWTSRFGLEFARQIVAHCSGTLTVEAAEGGFTTLRVDLPLQPRTEPEATTAPTTTSAGQETILVVEDETALRSLIVRSLKRHGYELLTASDGEEALRLAGEHAGTIHLLLTDVVMPGMSGLEVAEQLVANHPSLRVLFISGHSESLVASSNPIPGRSAVLEKPFRPAALAQRVRDLLDI